MYSWGTGRIGLSTFSDVTTPKALYFNLNNVGSSDDISQDSCEYPNGEKNIEFIDICAGRSHSLVVDNKNRVWIFGDIGTTQLAFCKYPILDRFLIGNSIKKVSCWDRNYAINDQDQVLQWGFSGDDDSSYLVPRLIPFNCRIKQVSCSLNNTIAVSNEGIAFVNIYQNQASNFKIVQYFVENKIEITQVACGIRHCLFLDSNGMVYSSGKGIQTGQYSDCSGLENLDINGKPEQEDNNFVNKNNFNSNNNSNNNNEYDKPKLIKELNNIIEIKAGFLHSIALDGYRKQVFGWGENLNGQLGMEGIEYVYEPTIISIPYVDIKSIEAGAYHTAFITSRGRLIMVGGVLVENANFRMNVALGNGLGGARTMQFRVSVEEDETVISDQIVIPKPESSLINVKEKEQFEKEKNESSTSVKDDQDEGEAILSKDEIMEFQYHLNEQYHNDYSRIQHNPQFIQDVFAKKVVDKVSCGLFHTLATLKVNEPQPIGTLEELCIEYISNNILASIESDSSFQEIYKLPSHLILKLDSFLTLSGNHNDKTLRLMHYLKSPPSYKNNNQFNSSSQSTSTLTLTSTSTSTSTNNSNNNNNNTIQNQWDEYLNYFIDFDSVLIASISDYSVITKSTNIQISIDSIKYIIETLKNDKNTSTAKTIKIESYKEIFTIISITNNRILALSKQYCLVIDKTNLLLVLAIFKRDLSSNIYNLKNFDSNILNLKINGY